MRRPFWRVAAACEIGTSHVSSGAPCQDHVAHGILRTREGPVLVAVVCDGPAAQRIPILGRGSLQQRL